MNVKFVARGVAYVALAASLLAAANCIEHLAISDGRSLKDRA